MANLDHPNIVRLYGEDVVCVLCASECYDDDMYFCRYLCYQPYPVSDGDCNTGTTQQVPSQTPVRAKLMACV